MTHVSLIPSILFNISQSQPIFPFVIIYTLTPQSQSSFHPLPPSFFTPPCPKTEIMSKILYMNIFPQQEQMQINNKQHINIVILGPSGSGKSTLTGHLLSHLSSPPQKQKILAQISEHQKIQPNTKYAWIMNTLKVQRDQGYTVQTASKRVETEKHSLFLIDVPGRREFIKNMMTGTTQADCCVLVVDAVEEKFRSGFVENGPTREHALLAYAFGVKQMIVVINKMDQVEFKEERYNVIKNEVSDFLKKVGFKISEVNFIPVSALEGDNLFGISPKMEWYKQLTVVQALDHFTPYKKVDKKHRPLRVTIQRVYNIGGVGTVPVGKVEFGVAKKGMKVVIMPGGYEGEIKSIETGKQAIEEGNPGDIVGLGFTSANFQQKIKKGCVIGEVNNDPPKTVESFLAQVVILTHPKSIKNGFTPMIQCHTSYIPCKIESILSKIDRNTGKTLSQNPQSLKNGDCAMIVFKPCQPLSCQAFTQYPTLGRFVARDNNITVAVGVIKKCEKKDPKT